MTDLQQTRIVHREIKRTIGRIAEEFDINIATLMGVLDIIKHELVQTHCIDTSDDEDEDEEDDTEEE
jgi:hypothetical protein